MVSCKVKKSPNVSDKHGLLSKNTYVYICIHIPMYFTLYTDINLQGICWEVLSDETFKGLREAGKGRGGSQGRLWAHQKHHLISVGALGHQWHHGAAPPQSKGTRLSFLHYSVTDWGLPPWDTHWPPRHCWTRQVISAKVILQKRVQHWTISSWDGCIG